ncbi:MAG: hypothetical protein R8M37_00070 [Alphaproteobacteria bacterium]|nr:hypothetical protein [Alphaproteobacteria bacterium]
MAQISALPRSPTPPGGVIGKIIIGGIIAAAIVVASIFTFGAAGIATGAAAGAMSAAVEAGAGLGMVVLQGGMAYAGSIATSAVVAGVIQKQNVQLLSFECIDYSRNWAFLVCKN